MNSAGNTAAEDLLSAARDCLAEDGFNGQGVWNSNEGRVSWCLESAVGIAGFSVYRIEEETGEEIRLNAALVPVAFYEPDARYAVVDPDAVEGGTGRYRLEAVTFAGEVKDVGTATLTFLDLEPVTSKRAAKQALPLHSLVTKSVTGVSSVLKVVLTEEGIYGVQLQAIADGMGLSLESVEVLAGNGSLRIRSGDCDVPTFYDVDNGQLVFHGEPTDNWYTREAAYLITAESGVSMPTRSLDADSGNSRFPFVRRFEEDAYPLFCAMQRPADFYYWNFVVSSIDPDAAGVDFPVDLDGYGDSPLTLRVDVQGWTLTDVNPDHHAEFLLNGTSVGSILFDDQDPVTAVLEIPAGLAVDGENTLTVRGVLSDASHFSYFVVDGITAEYHRTLTPLDGTVYVAADDYAAVSAAAFTSPLVLALDATGEPTCLSDGSGKAWSVVAGDARYAVAERVSLPLLEPIPAASDAWFMETDNRIDYLVVVSRDLAPAVEELAAYRTAQGWRVGVAVFEDICDLMTGGLRTPEAIPELLSYADTTWAESPQMLLLAGNGHADYLGTLNREVNHLPPLLQQTFDGLFAADERLADSGGDELPDLAVGRLPAESASELSTMIAKIKAYEAALGSDWQNRWVFANDQADDAGNYAASILQFASLLQDPYSMASRIDLDTMALAPARAALAEGFNEGAGLVHYTGHGVVTEWSGQGLLTVADVDAMNNEYTPVVVSLSCLSGHYETPGMDSLSERLMQHTSGGAVAVWASSALSRNAPATDLGDAFYRAILQEEGVTLGQAVQSARLSNPGDLFTRDTLSTYNLMGDPALRLSMKPPSVGVKESAQVGLQDLAQTYDGTPRTVTFVTDPTGLDVELTYNNSTTGPTTAGRYTVIATVSDPAYAGCTTGTLVVARAPASVTLSDLAQTYTGGERTASAATDPGGLAVAFTYDGSSESPVDAGTVEVVARISDINHDGSTAGSLVIAPASQRLEFPPISDQVTTGCVTLDATASSGLPVAYAISEGPGCINESGQLIFTGEGTVTVVASQAGDRNWTAAEDILRSLSVVLPNPLPQVSTTHVLVRENGEGRFFVRLPATPAEARTLTVSYLCGSTSFWVKGGASLTFKPSNWNIWQPVTLAAEDDDNSIEETASFRISGPGCSDQIMTATVLDDDIGPNLALASTGSKIKGPYSKRAGRLIDGIHTLRANSGIMVWTNNPHGSMTLDLKSETTVSRIRLLNWDWKNRTQQYRIDSSPDGITWSLLVNAAKGDHRGWEEWAVKAVSLRYLRLTGLGNSENQKVRFCEWEVYGDRPDPSPVTSSDHINVRENGEGRFFVKLDRRPMTRTTVTVSRVKGGGDVTVLNGSELVFTPANWKAWQRVTLIAGDDEGDANETAAIRIETAYETVQLVGATVLDDDIGPNLALASAGSTINGRVRAARLIDGVHTARTNYGYTVWTNDPPKTQVLDLKEATAVTRIRLLNWDWKFRTQRYRIEGSMDREEWSVLVDASEDEYQGWDEWQIDSSTVRYLRFTGLCNSENAKVRICEWEVYAEEVQKPQLSHAPSPRRVSSASVAVPVTVVTSDDGPDYTNGWAAVDGDLDTLWEGRPGDGGWYIAVGYGSTLSVTNIIVDLTEDSHADLQALTSLDGIEWQEWPEDASEFPVDLNYLWLLFPDDGMGSVPQIMEIEPQPYTP